MKAESELGIPSKISLLKDLAEDIPGGSTSGGRLGGNLEIVKDPKEPTLLSNS
jgi:hypothetical protein